MIQLKPENHCKYYARDCSATVIEGKDSILHINRIITSDIAGIADLEYCKSLICDANGKIIDAIEISNISGQLLLLGISANAENTRNLIVSGVHWNEDVKIMNGDGALSIISMFAENLEEIKRILGEKSVNESYSMWNEYGEYYTLNTQLKKDIQVNILIQSNRIQDFIGIIEAKGAESCTKELWDMHRIENGILSDEEYVHKFLPSELGLEKIVNLKKGCYPGQEIHARLESRGKITKKIRRYNADIQLESGTYTSNSGRKVTITSSSKNKGFAMLSVKENNEITLNDDISLLIEEL